MALKSLSRRIWSADAMLRVPLDKDDGLRYLFLLGLGLTGQDTFSAAEANRSRA